MLPRILSEFSFYGYLLVFLAGIVTSIGPCNLSMVPVIVGYIGGQEASRRQGFVISLLFTLGTATTFMLLGLFIGIAGGIFGVKKMIIYYFVAAVCVILGLNLLGVLKLNINYGGSLMRYTDNVKGLSGSYFLGLVMGLVGSQCGTPVLLVILSLALASGKWLYGATLLFVYALGRGLPIIAVGTFTGLLTRMDTFARWNNILEKVSGIIIVIMGGYFAWLA